MAYPTSYTEATLSDFIVAQLGEIATILGMGSAQPAVDEALAKCGISDIATITGSDDLNKLRIIARYEGWRLAMSSLAARYDFEADGGAFKRSQAFANAKTNLALATAEAQPYLDEVNPSFAFHQYGQTYNIGDLDDQT
jgi:hypothetical protein